MTVGRAVADGRPPLPLVVVTIVAVTAGLVPMMVFGNGTALLVGTAGAILACVFIAIRHPRICWLLAVASLPITMAWPFSASGANISVPLEILAGALAPLLLLTVFHDPHSIQRLLRHPLSMALGFQLAWMAGATVFSADPVVSAKAFAVRVVYLTVFYVGGFLFLDRGRTEHDADPLRTTTLAILFLAIPTTLWALASHASFGFARTESYEIAQPFFLNHTEYATVLVVWLCLSMGLCQTAQKRYRALLIPLVILLLAAVLTAGARSAWIALVAALATLVVVRFNPDPWKTTAVALLLALAVGISTVGLSSRSLDQRAPSGQTIAQAPAAGSFFVLDLVADESSIERLNRWHSAVRMLRDRPLFGFGPSTYETKYGTYQQHQQLTRVSTFKGDRGGAHSEFMTVAAEQGLGGLFALVAVVILGLRSGLRSVRHAATSRDHWWAAAWTAAFVALVVSSCFNSLLELDKTAPLFWLAAAILVSLDMKQRQASTRE